MPLILFTARKGSTQKGLMAMAGNMSVYGISAAALTAANVTANLVTTAAPG